MPRRAAWILVLACALPAAAQKGAGQAVLSELWQRRVLPPDKNEASSADLLLLARMHRVEVDDAVGYLREKIHGLRGLAVLIRDRKTRQTNWRLTKEGFDKYLFLRTQDALAYFQAHDVGYKWAFMAKDMRDAPLFDQTGLLTDAGLTVYDRLLANVEAHYRLPDGTIAGNRAPPKPAEPPPVPEAAAPSPRFRRPVTQAPPEEPPQPAERAPASPPPAGQEASQPPSGNGQAVQPDSNRQSVSAPPPEAQSAPAPDPGPAPSDSD